MVYALEMFFDKSAEDMIYGFFNDLKENNISSYMLDVDARPHISIGVFNDIDIADCSNRLKRFCEQTSKINISFSSLGVFTFPKPCLFLAPIVNQSLIEIHNKLHSLFNDTNHTGFEYYLPNEWVPHCAIDISPDINVICKSTDLIMKKFIPIDCEIFEIGWVEISNPAIRLNSFSLNKIYSQRNGKSND
jgi:hypothetical protein